MGEVVVGATMRLEMADLRGLAKRIGKPSIVGKDTASYGIGTSG